MQVGVKQVLLRSKGEQKGEGLPPGTPCGVVYGQVSALRSVDLTTASRLRRADTPICKEKRPKRKPITIAVLSRALPPSYGSTYLSGTAVQTNRATSTTPHEINGVRLNIYSGKCNVPASPEMVVVDYKLGSTLRLGDLIAYRLDGLMEHRNIVSLTKMPNCIEGVRSFV